MSDTPKKKEDSDKVVSDHDSPEQGGEGTIQMDNEHKSRGKHPMYEIDVGFVDHSSSGSKVPNVSESQKANANQ